MSTNNLNTENSLIIHKEGDTLTFEYNGEEIFLNIGQDDDTGMVVVDLLQQLGFDTQIF